MDTRTVRKGLYAAVLVAAGLVLTACGPDEASAGPSTGSPAPQSSQGSAPATHSAGSTGSSTANDGRDSARSTRLGMPKKPGVKCTDQLNYAGDARSNAEINSIGERTGACPPISSSAGGGVAHAGNHHTYVGTLKYLAPGKLTVKPQGGGMEQAFYVSNATRVLGAAAICSDTDGRVTIGGDGYGTSTCTVHQLEVAAKTDSVTVRVTMDTRSGGAETVEEKYHP